MVKFICIYEGCTAAYGQKYRLLRHMQCAHASSVVCQQCGKLFKNQLSLDKHCRSHKKRVYACTFDGCNKAFLKHQHLKVHEFQHTGIKPFACCVCLKRFEVPSKLKSHLKVHAGYKCAVDGCGKHFANWTLLRKHAAVYHMGSYKCDICCKVFAKPRYLRYHLKKHEKDEKSTNLASSLTVSSCVAAESALTAYPKKEGRVYSCSVDGCPKSFKTAAHLKRHVDGVHLKIQDQREYVPCDFEGCGKLFQTHQKMVDHRNVHFGTRPYECLLQGCTKAYMNRDALKWHCKSAHQQTLKSLELRQHLQSKCMVFGDDSETEKLR